MKKAALYARRAASSPTRCGIERAQRSRGDVPQAKRLSTSALAALLFCGCPLVGAGAATAAPDVSGDTFFDATRIWRIDLTLTPEQFAAMEPEGGPGPFGRPGAGRRGFGPATFNVPIFMGQGDADHDRRLTHEELTRLGQGWFSAWDVDRTGRLTQAALRDGINKTMVLGGPGGRGPGRGFGLQGREGQRHGLASVMGIEFKWATADLEIAGHAYPSVAVRYKGNATFVQSRASLKRPLKIDLDRGHPGRSFAGVTRLNLHNNITDASWMNEVLTYRLFREAGVPASRTTYARVYLTVPGKHARRYLGLYSVVENVDRQFLEHRFSSSAGALFKPVTPRPLEELGDSWAAYALPYDPKLPVTEVQQKQLVALCALISKGSDAELAARLPEMVDLDELARFLAVTVWLSNMDSILGMGQNYYVYLPPETGRLLFIPWDHDHSFGQFPLVGTQEQREQLRLTKPWFGQARFLERLFAVEGFRQLYLEKMSELSRTLARPERFQRQVDELAPILRPAVAEESAEKLARFEKVVAGEAVAPMGMDGRPAGPPPPDGRGGPSPGGPRPGPPAVFSEPVKPIKAFVTARARSVDDQLAGRSEGATVGPFLFGGGAGSRPTGEPGRGGGFQPATFLLPVFLGSFDVDHDGTLTAAEFGEGIERWFTKWDTDQSGVLTEDELWEGINEDFAR